MFFGLKGLVEAFVVTTASKGPAGVLVNDEDFTTDDDVVLIAVEKLLGLDGVVEVPDKRSVR